MAAARVSSARMFATSITRRFCWSLMVVVVVLALWEVLARQAMDVKSTNHAAVDLNYQLRRVVERGLQPYDRQGSPAAGYNFVLDIHSHTTESDGSLTPEQLVDYAVAEGLDGLAVTDHQTINGAVLAERYAADVHPSFVVLRGLEYTTCRCHLNLVGFVNGSDEASRIDSAYQEILDLIKPWPTDEEIERVIALTHVASGIAIVNHLPWSTHVQNRRNEPALPRHPTLSVSTRALPLPVFSLFDEKRVASACS
jgi:hypothetical protein